MFRIVCDPSSGSVERASLKLLVIFFVCVVGVRQRNFEPAVCAPGTTSWELLYSSSQLVVPGTHTAGSKFETPLGCPVWFEEWPTGDSTMEERNTTAQQ